ncbi:MAG TPA: fructosamine kinase family protein [Streptosporangiaceae bacterium]|nr:fructosamine kinase family protein [Streptosporangiaceae bacterium]
MDRATRTRLEQLLGAGLLAAQSLGGAHGVRHYRLELAGGRSAFAKIQDQDPSGNEHDAFAAEAHGLRWLGEAGAAPVPAVLASDPACLVTDWIDTGRPTPETARTFGRELARLHAAGAASFGAPWPGVIAGLPLPNDAADSWPDWYAANRLLPYARIASDAGTLGPADITLIESAAARSADVAGPPERPSRIHGDCWSGNVLWSAGRGWLIDPAAHGGHRESDLAMLALFGAPFLDQILATYAETAPLADGWQTRIPLHQLHPLLVHVCLFGGSYREAAVSAARAVLAS